MGPQEDYIETVVTCEGDFHDPQLPHRLEFFRRQLKDLLLADPQKQVIVKKVEPWNSVRVTLNIPRQAALRLKQLAEQGNSRLRQLGVLAVQIEGDHLVSLTLATPGNQRTELILRTAASSAGLSQTAASASVAVFDSGLPSSSDELGSPGPTNVEVTRKNIEEYLRQGSSLFHNSVLTPATTASTNYIPASSNDVFKTPNIVEASVLRSSGGGNDKVSVASNILGSSPALSGLHQRLPVPPPSHGVTAETGTFPQPLTSTPIRQGQQGTKAVGIHTTVQTMTSPSQAMALPQTASVGFNTMCLPPPPPYPHSQGASSGVANHIGRQGRKVTASSPLLINLLQTEPMAASSSPSNSKGLSAGQGSIDKSKKKRRVRRKKDTGTLTQSGGGNDLISDSTSSSGMGSVVASSTCVGDLFSTKVSISGSVDVNSSSGHVSETSMDTSSMPVGVDDAVIGRGSLQISSGFSQMGGESIINPYTGHMEPRELASDLSPLRGEPAPLHTDAPEGSGLDIAVLTSSPTTTSPPSSTIAGSSNFIPPLASGIVDSAFKDSQQRNFPSPPLVSVPQSTLPHVDLIELRRRQHSNEPLGKPHVPGGVMSSQAYAQHRSSPLSPVVTQPPPLAVLELHNSPLPAVVANHPQSSVNGLAVSTSSVTVPANGDSLGEMHLGSSGMLTASPASVVPVSQSELMRVSSEPVQNKEFESCVRDSASDVSAKSSKPTDDAPAPQPDVLVANVHPFLAQGRTECAAVASLHHSLRHALIKSSVTAENPSLALLNMSPAPAVLSPPQAVQRVAVGDSASVGTASPTGSKTLSEGDDSSNHSCIGPDGPSDATSAGTALLDGATTKVYNNDSGVGSSSERSDDTPSEAGDGEYHSGTGGLGDGTAAEGGACSKQVMGGNKGIVNCEPSTSKPDSHLTIGFVHNSQLTTPGMLNRKDAAVSGLKDAAAMTHQHSQSSASAEKSIPADSDEMLMKSMHPVASSSQAVPVLNKGMPTMAVQYLSSAHPDVHQQISHHKNRVANCQVSGVHQNGPVLLPHAHAPEQPLSNSQGNSLPHLISSYTSGIQVSSLPHTPGSSVSHSAGSSVLQPASVPHARGISGTGTAGLAPAHPGGKPSVHVTSPAPSTSTMPRLPYMQGVTLSCASTHSPSITVSRTQSLAVSHTHMSITSSAPATSVACAVGPVTTSITGTTQNCVLSSGHNTDIKTAVVNITDSSKSNAIVPVTVLASSKQHGISVAAVTTAAITTPTATGSRLHHKHSAATPHSTDLMDTSSLEAAVSLPEMMVGEASDLDVLEEAHQLFYGNSGEATSLSSFDEDLMLASHPTRDNGMVGYLEAGGRHSSSNGNGSMSIGSVGGGTISAEVRNANITSMYCKRSSPVNVNMLNHIYAPGLPLPRRLTESVQRLVKPLPTTETALPPVRACKSPGASSSRHSTNGSTSPGRASQGGARSPGASLSSARVLSFDKAPVGPSNNMAVLPSNMARGSYHPAQYSEHSGCDLNSMHSSSLKTGVAPHLHSANPSTAVAVPNAQSYAPASTCFSQQPSTSGISTQSHGGFPQVMGPCVQTPWSGPHNPVPGAGGRLQPPPPPLVSSTSATLTTQVHPPSTSTPHLYHHHASGKNSAMSHPASHIPQLLPLSTSAFHPATTASVVVTTSSVHGLLASMTSSEQVPEVSLVSSQTTITTTGGSISSSPSHPLPPPPVLVQRASSPSVPVCINSQSGSLDWGVTSEDSPTQASSFALSHSLSSASLIKETSPHAASSVTTIAVPVTATASTACVSGVEGLQAAVLTSASVVTVSAVGTLASTVPFTTSDGALGTAGVALFTSVNPNLASDSPSTVTVYVEKNPTQTVDSQPTSIEHFYSSAHTQAAEGRSHGSKISEGHDTVACAELVREPGHGNGQGVGSLTAARVMSSISGQEASITTADFSNLPWSHPSSANQSHDLHYVASEHASNLHHNLDNTLDASAPDGPATKVQDSNNVEDMCKVLVTSSHSVPAVDSCTTACNSGISTNNVAVSIAELASGDTHSASDLPSSTTAAVDACTTVTSRAHGLLKHVHSDAVGTNVHVGTIASAQESSVANIHLGPAPSAQNVPSTSTRQGTDDTGHSGLLTNMHRSSLAAADNFQVNNTASGSVSTAFVTSEHIGSVATTQTTLEVTSAMGKTLVPHAGASVAHIDSEDSASLELGPEMVVVPDITKNHVSLVALAQKAAAQAIALKNQELKNLEPDRLACAVTSIHLKVSAAQSSPAAELSSVVVPDVCNTGDAGKEAYVDGEGSWGQVVGVGSNEGLVASTQPPVLSLSSAATPMPEEVENSSCPPAENPHSRPPLLHPAPLLSSAPTIVPSATPPPPSLTPVLQEFGKKDPHVPSGTSQSSKPDGAPSDVAMTAKQGDREAVGSMSDSLEEASTKTRRITRKRRSTQSESDSGEPAPKLNSVEPEASVTAPGSGIVTKQATESGKAIVWDQPPRLSREGKKSSGSSGFSGDEKDKASSKTSSNNDAAHHHHFERNIIEATPEEIAKKNAASSAGRRRAFYAYVLEKSLGQSYFDTPVLCGRTRSQSSTTSKDSNTATTAAATVAPSQIPQIAGTSASQNPQVHKEDTEVTTPGSKRSTRSLRTKDSTDVSGNKRKRAKEHR